MTSQYQVCYPKPKLIMGNMIGLASTICVITNIMYIWYWLIMGDMVGPAGTSCAITYIISGTG